MWSGQPHSCNNSREETKQWLLVHGFGSVILVLFAQFNLKHHLILDSFISARV
ncbi:hypothetical protein TGAM01_v209619 [Trichoderma gamsii]|uniref:Uncharacterized protein n=1 Tax=Trichoderma gamsii TaxID=398673 RepID=A0A2P4ZB18_9HYPO|nr:hypothetical protein TGAM01_v209619 [Trichoderma gamsii]PON21456.1 hypothetical protein TGAM01_v209619 [Trichoderma gamsii]